MNRLWLLMPLSLIPAAWWLLGADLGFFLVWWLALSLIGLLVWPLAARLFPGGDRGWLLAKPLGLVLAALALWTLSYLKILPFQRWTVTLVLCALGLLVWLLRDGWRNITKTWNDGPTCRRIAFSEMLFAAGLLFWTFARGLKPELDSLEKFMDVGFMNTLWRTDYLPALDMWLSGGKINYYYFGQYVYTFLAKLTAIRPEVSYNLGMATTFAMTLGLSYAVASRLLGLARKLDPQLPRAAPVTGGLIAAGLTTFAGNGHAFLYAPGSPGQWLLKWLHARGLVGGDITQTFWFADSTRFIGYNPDTVDKTIHEFPYYSFLVADLHAHLINLAFVLLLLALLTRLVNHTGLLSAAAACRRNQEQNLESDDRSWLRNEMKQVRSRFKSTVLNVTLLLAGILLAVFMMGNYWDFAIYFVVTAMVLLVVNSRGYGRVTRGSGLLIFALQCILIIVPFLTVSQPILAVALFFLALLVNNYLTVVSGDALTITGAQMTWVFFLAHLLTLPFSTSFEPISKSIALAVNHTPVWQLIILWGPHLMAGLLLAVFFMIRNSPGRRLRRVFPPAPEDRAAATQPDTRRGRLLRVLSPSDLLACILLVCAAGLILVPELVYVVDIYSGDYKRANTMFKFTYQAFVLLSLVWGYAVVRVLSASRFLRVRSLSGHQSALHRNRGDRTSWAVRVIGVLLALSLVIPFWYPLVATRQWLGEFTIERYQGLDGLLPISAKDSSEIPGQAQGELSADYAAINWLNENVAGQPVILEAAGSSYSDYGRISTFTGLPAVFGWETHEWLWRTSKGNPDAYGSVVLPRQEDVRLMYTTSDQAERLALLEKYQVAYVIIGDLEHQKYSEVLEDGSQHSLVQSDLLMGLGPVVFSEQNLVIIKLR